MKLPLPQKPSFNLICNWLEINEEILYEYIISNEINAYIRADVFEDCDIEFKDRIIDYKEVF